MVVFTATTLVVNNPPAEITPPAIESPTTKGSTAQSNIGRSVAGSPVVTYWVSLVKLALMTNCNGTPAGNSWPSMPLLSMVTNIESATTSTLLIITVSVEI